MAVSRRGFLSRALLGTAGLAAAGSVPLALRRTRLRPLPPGRPLRFFTPREFSIFAAVADRIVPQLSADQPTVEELDVPGKADELLSRADPDTQHDFRQLLALFDSALAAFLLDGRPTPFTELSPDAQDRALAQWRTSRLPLRCRIAAGSGLPPRAGSAATRRRRAGGRLRKRSSSGGTAASCPACCAWPSSPARQER